VVARDARVLSHYTAVFFGNPPHFFSQKTQRRVCFFNIKQALCKVAQSTLQKPENTTKQSILNQRHGSSFAHKWCLWLFAACNTIDMDARANLIRVR
jgi:hypothetical protein